MPTPLQDRTRRFLARPIPSGLDYVKDSLAERLLATYAKRGTWPPDGDAAELAELAILETTALLESLTDPPAIAYLQESAELLRAMLAESR